MRIGIGYDVHRLVAGRRLVLGGSISRIPPACWAIRTRMYCCTPSVMPCWGLRPWAISAVISPMITAIKILTVSCCWPGWAHQIREAGYRVANIDATVVAQEPRLAGYIEAMVANIANCLGIAPGQVNVKATTTETLGFEGQKLGISAQAVALLEKL